MERIRIAVIGVGNCANSLIQGIYYYRDKAPEDAVGLMHWDVGGYTPGDIEVVAAFDVDARKVGCDLSEAIFAPPNCTKVFKEDIPVTGVKVAMGRVMDGVADHMKDYPEDETFVVSDGPEADVVSVLEENGAEIVLNYLPVGSEDATRYYAGCCLEAGVAFINCMPVFIASDPSWANKFMEKGVPVVGDDIKAQIGATITHRTLAKLFADRGVTLDRTYQMNTGGNTDFLNMLAPERLKSKKISKTEAVQSVLPKPLDERNIHIGPSDYIPWLKDNKVCFLRMEGSIFGGVPMNVELRLSVEDSPNSAGCAIDAIRCSKIALDRGIGGPLLSISSYTMKHPLQQFSDNRARQMVEEFIEDKRER
ncbi:inositol-3-phosphate synthase [bacterium BMS3Bbin06]|nr:inositol-3-phosphate synthase [bacterium BMS3Abin08]GBE35183.1 inositol-3-phosphate synthase [bacterium BMS3Bbin06]HDO35882.1 inositol-3-phosphate synthase [Nitrospirota bacterium]HDY70298.1 inositol-3-phosphate synthase [Nitrospirota bacterium]